MDKIGYPNRFNFAARPSAAPERPQDAGPVDKVAISEKSPSDAVLYRGQPVHGWKAAATATAVLGLAGTGLVGGALAGAAIASALGVALAPICAVAGAIFGFRGSLLINGKEAFVHSAGESQGTHLAKQIGNLAVRTGVGVLGGMIGGALAPMVAMGGGAIAGFKVAGKAAVYLIENVIHPERS
jgi:hypothetical protein